MTFRQGLKDVKEGVTGTEEPHSKDPKVGTSSQREEQERCPRAPPDRDRSWRCGRGLGRGFGLCSGGRGGPGGFSAGDRVTREEAGGPGPR